MSAVNIAITADRALVFTDAAHYDDEGRLVHLGDKAPVTATGLVVTGRGNSLFVPLIARQLDRLGWDIDTVQLDAGAFIEIAFGAVEGTLKAAAGKTWNDIFIIGWSAASGRPKVAQWTNCAPAGVPRFSMVDSVMAPDMSPAGYERVRRLIGSKARADMDPVGFCLAVMMAQRFEEGTVAFGAGGQFLVGGHITLTQVLATGVAKDVVHSWPEDRVGEKILPRIDPAPVLHPPSMFPSAMNRAERRRQEKTRRKALA